ncbi:MAG: hypothetical protein IIC51_06060, partial [Planctomycetes bacterium]|nr:hypothetical protein [Planctomycetota bacterium]
MRIIFLGSGRFAMPTLRWLAESDHTVALVVTQPARPSGRGRRIVRTPVQALAEDLGLETIAIQDVNEPESARDLLALDARIGLAIDFGQKIGPALLGGWPGGCLNLHGSLLPRYRGAAPINWAIVNGEERTGCTVFRMVEKMDSIEEANGTILDSASVSDWTALGIEVLNDVAVLSHFSATEGTFDTGTYKISSIIAGELTLARSVYPAGLPGTQSAAVTFRIMRGPKSYDPITNKLTLIVADLITAAEVADDGSPYFADALDAGYSKGQTPTGCPLIAVFADRLILAGQTDFPHLWYASRKGDYLDWSFGRPADDTAQAVAGAATDAGIIGEPLTALVPHSSDYLVLSTISQLWVLRVDPYLG